MNSIQLPGFPTDLPSTVEVRDFDMGNGEFFRVVMRLEAQPVNDHFRMWAQAFEMNADGSFKQAPFGVPSRSNETAHSVMASALGDTFDMDDAWMRADSVDYDPDAPGDIKVVEDFPQQPEYGDVVMYNGQLLRWTKGWADTVAETKIADLKRVLSTSNIRSGYGFRRR